MKTPNSVSSEPGAGQIDDIVEEQKAVAGETLLTILQRIDISFSDAWSTLLQAHMLRVTNVKDICVDLAKAGKIENTWGGGNRKPRDEDMIVLKR